MKAAALAVVLAAAPARAQSFDFVQVPEACAPFWTIPGADDSPTGWNQVLSFAACVQDNRTASIDDVDALPAFIDAMAARLRLPMTWYLAAARAGDPPTALRAVYNIGLGQLALMTRARSSIPRSSPRYALLHARLEPLLQPAAHVAIVAFAAVEAAAAEEPSATPDELTRGLVRSAHVLRLQLQRDWPDELPDFLVARP